MTKERARREPHLAEPPGYRFGLEEIPMPAVFATYRIIRDCNEAFSGLFGVSRSELINESFSKLYASIGDFVSIGERWTTGLHGGGRYRDERIMKGGDGTPFWCSVTGVTRTPHDSLAAVVYCFAPTTRPVAPDVMALTDRQRQVLTLVADGRTNLEIAAELGLSPRTAEAHRARLMKAIGVRNSAELSAWFVSRQR